MLKLKGPSMGISGRFKLDVLNSKEELVEDKCLPEQKNLITEGGLSQFLSASGTSFRLALGTGSTPPQREDVVLDNYLTISTTGVEFRGSGYVTRVDTNTFEATREIVFGLGQVVGNITELGLAYGLTFGDYGYPLLSYSLATRALIKDSLGNATSIELLEDEQLRVTYTLRVEVSDSSEPFTLSVNNDGTLEDHTVTPNFGMRDQITNYGMFVGRSASNYRHQSIYTSFASARNNSNAADSAEISSGTFSADRKTYTIEIKAFAGIGRWNGEIAWVGVIDHIRGGKTGSFTYNDFQERFNTGSTSFIWQIDPPITKTQDHAMEITCSLSVSYGD